MTDSPSDTTQTEVAAEGDAEEASLAADLAASVGSTAWRDDHGTVHIEVAPEQWVSAISTIAETFPFFSWLSAVDWSKEVEVGEPADDAENLEERFDVLCRLSSLTNGDAAIVLTSVAKDDAAVDSIVDVFPGAGWHEREAAEMFGIHFRGNPNLSKLYLPDSFEGNPLLKSYPLLAREVKPWPGTVDVEDMPSVENAEAGA